MVGLRRAHPRLPLVLLALALGGCSLLSTVFGGGQDPTAGPAVANGPDQASVDAEALAELDALRSAVADPSTATTTGATQPDALRSYAAAHCFALESGLFARVGGGEARSAELDAWLAAAIEASAETRETWALLDLRARLHALTGRAEEAAAAWLTILEQGGELEAFNAIAGLGRSPTIDAALVDACAIVRPRVGEAELADFVALCLARAGGDGSRLAWASAPADIEHYQRVVEAREQQALAAQVEAERLAQARMWLMATMFATGRCSFSDCLTEGWDTDTAAGTLRSRCRFSDCMKDGWDTELPDGSRAETRCRFSDCAKEGWDTRLPDGSTAETRCRFGNCFEDGWDTRFEGSTAEGRCRFSNCFEDGWELRPREGPSVECRCRFGACLTDGTECG